MSWLQRLANTFRADRVEHDVQREKHDHDGGRFPTVRIAGGRHARMQPVASGGDHFTAAASAPRKAAATCAT